MERIEEELRPDVVRIRFSFGDDWSGDPGVFVRVLLSDAASQRSSLAEFTREVGGRIFDFMRQANLDYLPWFSFRAESEQKRLNDPEWD